jgi:hypothetical protein
MFQFATPDVFQLMHNLQINSIEPNSAKLDVSESEIGGSDISRSSDNLGETVMVEPLDWRTPLVHYLENPGHITDRKVQWQASKYVLLDNELYC